MVRWWKSAVNFSFFLCLAACRMRSSACDTLSRCCARHVLCWLAFPSASALGSTGSAVDCSTLFVGFAATMAESELLAPVHHRLQLLAFPMRTETVTPPVRRETSRFLRKKRRHMPGSLTTPGCPSTRALTCSTMLPSAISTASAPRIFLSRLNGWRVPSPMRMRGGTSIAAWNSYLVTIKWSAL